MKLKIPPALLFLLCMFLMWSIARLSNIKHIDFEYQKATSQLFFGIGVVVALIALYAFRKARTTVDPTQPNKASKLVIVGIYKITRNPMYLGMLFLLLGFLIRLGNLYGLPVVLLFIWYMTTFQIKPEEEALAQSFGALYENYCKKVRRWI